ncbi:MAG: hypothetical protein C0415_00805 [Thermodesulfovibrio sp.]|nr:hypothetical protein [Thermodesulfovibrio sp.]
MKGVLKGLFFYEVGTCTGPLIDFYETDDDLVFEVDLPGTDPSNISIRVYENLLIIEGVRVESNDEFAESKFKYLCMERGMRRFRRVLKIPIFVNTTAGEASYCNGVLTVKFPKLKGKLIKIMIEKREIE